MTDRRLVAGGLALAGLLALGGTLPATVPAGPTVALPDVPIDCPPTCAVDVRLPLQAGGVALSGRVEGTRVWLRLGEAASRSDPEGALRVVTDAAPDHATVVARAKRPGRVTGLAVGPARRSAARVAVLALAEVLAGLLLAAALRRLARVRGALAVAGALGAALAVGVLLPMPRLEALLTWITGVRADHHTSGYATPDLPFVVQKVGGHGGAFAGLGGFGAWSGAGAGPVALRLATLAILTEAAQCLTPDRSPSVLDAGVDLAGGVVGYLLVRAALGRR